MSDANKIKSPEKKLNKGIIKNNNDNNKNQVNLNRKDTNSASIKTKKINSFQNQRKYQDKSKLKKKNDGDIAVNLFFKQGKFLNHPKILKSFLSFFNIRELFIIMELDNHIFQAVNESEVFKKYLLIRNDFVNKKDDKLNIYKEKIKNKPPINNNNDKLPKKVNFFLNDKESNNDDSKENEYKRTELKLADIDFQKLKIKYLINNNCQMIKKYIKTYSLTNSECHSIFNGIFEYLIIKEKGIPNIENNEPKIFSLPYDQISNSLNYFIESIMNLEYPNVYKLDISNIGISSVNQIKKIYSIFQRYSNHLRILSLSNNGINDKNAKILFAGLQNNNVLKVLNLSYNEIGEEGLGTNFFSSNKSLDTLILHHNLLGPIGIDYLFNYLISNKHMNLKSLEIGYNGITKEGTEYISKYIKDNQSLMTINIEGNYLCNEGIKIICDSINQKNGKNNISFLDLQNNNISNKGCQHISDMLSESPFINGISLRNNLLYNEGINKIISGISNSNLISLDISDTKIDEKTMKIISEKINKNIALQKLTLSYNDFSAGGNYIKNLLINESNLKYLDLSFCNISTQFNLIFQGLAKNQNIKLINFSGNYIPMRKEILNELGKVINDNKNIKNLILNECNMDDIGMNYINNNLEKNHSLITLSMNRNFITKKSIPGLENAIIKSGVIKNIYLFENHELNIKMIKQIENALKNNCKIIVNITKENENEKVKDKEKENDDNKNE